MSHLQGLPISVRTRIAEFQCKRTTQRNVHLFAGCNEQFLSRFMLNLTEVFIMPGESILKHGDIARQLCFAHTGVLVVTDIKGTLIELISGEGEAFFLLHTNTWHRLYPLCTTGTACISPAALANYVSIVRFA
jgi:hypothetical protein